MCVYNEEKIIEKALKSTRDYVSEIVVVHDGPCSDKTGHIVKKYGGIFVETKKNKGEAEFIRIKSYELAGQKYILQLDADEYLTQDIQNILSDAVETNADFITVNWATYRNAEIVRTLVRRPFLFKKDKVYFVECPHESVRPKTNATLEHYKVDLFNDADDRFKNQKELDKQQLIKQAKWVAPHAEALLKYSELRRYGVDDKNCRGSLFNELMASNMYRLHTIITIPILIISYNLAMYLKMKRLRPLFFIPNSYITIKYYRDLSKKITYLRFKHQKNA
jgi:glycosyltransferase involved in cell wall biosynthesis